MIGTSLEVYPANTLICTSKKAKIYLVDPDLKRNVGTVIKEKTTVGVPLLVEKLNGV